MYKSVPSVILAVMIYVWGLTVKTHPLSLKRT